MTMIDLIRHDPVWLVAIVGLFSLLIGSFLNVVIYRLPIILERQWQHECAMLSGHTTSPLDSTPFNLVIPRSQCPSCGHAISALENIPLLSYLVLGGKCRGCHTAISAQYPLIELTTALLSMIVAWQSGYSMQLVVLLPFIWTLIALFMIDAKTMLLPDNLTLPLLWAGLAINYYGVFTDLHSSVLGAIIGYVSVWSIYQVFKLLTGKEGMGYGDFKLLAALGAWGGWIVLPFVIFSASAFGAVFGAVWLVVQRRKTSTPLPFGPWLAVAGGVALVWHDSISRYTLRFLFP